MINECPNTLGVTVLGKNQKEKTALLFNPRCKLWSCDYCAEINKDEWIHRASRGAIIMQTEGREMVFVTLTSRPYATPVQSLLYFKENWPKLNRRMKYHTEKGKKSGGAIWDYFLVPEQHKTGAVHVHIIATTPIQDKKRWKHHAHSCGFGYILDVQPLVSPFACANYVAKYLHKEAGAETWPKGFRRVRSSRGWPKADEKPLEGWDWETYSNEETIWLEKNALINMGWEVTDKTLQ